MVFGHNLQMPDDLNQKNWGYIQLINALLLHENTRYKMHQL